MGRISTGVFLTPTSVRCLDKKKVCVGGLLIWVLDDLFNCFFDGDSVSFVAFFCLASFGPAFANSLDWVLVFDTVKHGE